MSTTLDITQFAPAETSFLHLKSPIDEDPLYVTDEDGKHKVGITFHCPGSEAYEAAATRRANRSLARSKKKIDLTADLMRAYAINWLTDVTASFDHLGYSPATDLTGDEMFKALYADRKYGWVVEQANAHQADWGNAMKGSAKS